MKRRPPASAAGVLAVLASVCTGPLAACGDALDPARRQQVQAQGLQVAYAPSAWPIPVGEFFTLQVEVCETSGPGGTALAAVDATMPAHRHGMNYRPRVQPLGGGRFSVEGMLFHMPGRWRLSFELGQGASARLVSHEVDVP